MENKDAADVFRLLQAIETERLAAGLELLRTDPISRTPTVNSLRFLEGLFGRPDGLGVTLLRGAVTGLDDPEIAAASCVELANDVLDHDKKNL